VAQVNVQEEYLVDANAIWKVLADFGGLASWMPGVDSCEVQGEGIGAVRMVALGSALVKERLEAFDESARSLSYCIFEGPIPLLNHLTTIVVNEGEHGGCSVNWSATFETPDGVPEDAIEGALSAAYSGALNALKEKLG
jgi:carbon monoxide dehydrogenase subunit G